MFPNTGKIKIYQILIILVTSIFGTVSMWDFWSEGTYALGCNMWIFSSVVVTIMALHRGIKKKSTLTWYVPLMFLSLSFFLYENNFFKIINFLTFGPIALFMFHVTEGDAPYWSLGSFGTRISRMCGIFHIVHVKSILNTLLPRTQRGNIKNIFTGVCILLVLLLIIVPILTSIDNDFSEFIGSLTDIFSFGSVAKIIVSICVAIPLLLIIFTSENENIKSSEKTENDPIIASIVLLGILFFYCIFLFFQADKLIIFGFSNVFSEVEDLVKGGFWQLLFLSILNIVLLRIFFTQKIIIIYRTLIVFIIASFGLVFSAAWRMYLYVLWYGLSFEKFYAGYAIIFCILIFLLFLVFILKKKSFDPVKISMLVCLWMFGIVSILPVPSMIFYINTAYHAKPDTRICLSFLRFLGPDVYHLIRSNANLVESAVACDKAINRSQYDHIPKISELVWYSDFILLPHERSDKNVTYQMQRILPNYRVSPEGEVVFQKGEWTLNDFRMHYAYNIKDNPPNILQVNTDTLTSTPQIPMSIAKPGINNL